MLVISIRTRSQKPRISIFEFAFMVYCLWYYLIPSASLSVNFMLMLGACILYIFYVVQVIPVSYAKEVGKLLIVATIIAASYYFLTETATISANVRHYDLKRFFSKFSQVFFGFFPLLLYARFHFAASRKQKMSIIIVILAMIAFVLIKTWMALTINGYVTRSQQYRVEATQNDVGTYGFTYAVSMLIPTIMICLYYTKSITFKVCCVGAIGFLLLFLLKAKYSIAIIIALFGVVGFILISGKDPVPKVLIIGICGMIFITLTTVLNYVVKQMEVNDVTIRLSEISSALSGEGIGYNLGGRLSLYLKTITAFLYSPIWGNYKLDFDGHATLLTVLSDVGLIGGIPYYYAYFSSQKRVSKLLGNRNAYKKFLPVFCCFIFMGYMNPIHSTLPIYIVVWLLAPLLIDLMDPNDMLSTQAVECQEGDE